MAETTESGERLGSWRSNVPYLRIAAGVLGLVVLVLLGRGYQSARRETERQYTCISNMKSLALSTLAYAGDWDGRLPPAPKVRFRRSLEEGRVTGGPVDLARYFPPDDWHRQIHYRNSQVFICPSTRSVYSYEFFYPLYGVRLEQCGSAIMECETGFMEGRPPGPHRSYYNVTYCDGHASWIQFNGLDEER